MFNRGLLANQLWLLVLVLTSSVQSNVYRHNYKYALKQPYTYQKDHSMPFYTAHGSAQVSHEVVRLTNQGMSDNRGMIWSKQPYKLQGEQSSVEYGFRVNISVSVGGTDQTAGKGFALFMTSSRPSYIADQNLPDGANLGNFFAGHSHNEPVDGVVVVFSSVASEGGGSRNMPFVYALALNQAYLSLHSEDELIRKYSLGGCYNQYRNVGQQQSKVYVDYRNDVFSVYIGDQAQPCVFNSKVSEKIDFRKLLSSDGVYLGLGASTMPVSGDQHDLHSIDVFDFFEPIVDAEPVDHHKKHVLTEDDNRLFDEIHHKIENLRHHQDGDAVHSSQTTDQPIGIGSASMEKLVNSVREVEFRILNKLDDVLTRLNVGNGDGSQQPIAGAGSGDGGLSTKVDHLEQMTSQVLSLLQQMANYLTHQQNEAGGGAQSKEDLRQLQNQLHQLHSTVSDSKQKMDQVHQQINDPLHRRHWFNESSFWYGLALFIIAQLVLTFMYGRFMRGPVEQNKKFLQANPFI
ncbi:hypothetical protein MIR68_012405 [Amoeboaphelidium protococcarum]|nr:hypothetical protein MIR68_012405 [Amoeboaphelidium protococcarum]